MYRTSIYGLDFRRSGEMLEALQPFAELLEKQIYLHHGRRETLMLPIGDTRREIYVHIQCSLNPKETIYESAFEIELNNLAGRGLMPQSGQVGCEDIYDEYGTVLAQVVDNNIFVLFDPSYCSEAAAVIERIMDEYLVVTSFDTSEKFLRRLEAQTARQSKESFKNFYLANLEDDAAQSEDQRLRAEVEIRRLQGKIMALVEDRTTATRHRDAARALIRSIDDREVQALFDQLAEISADGKVRVTKRFIQVRTAPITIKHGDVIYDIGEFAINIYPDRRYGGVRCVNLTRVVKDCYHPHVLRNGIPCLGSIADTLPKLIAGREYLGVVMLMITFLKNFTSGSAYASITDWPVQE